MQRWQLVVSLILASLSVLVFAAAPTAAQTPPPDTLVVRGDHAYPPYEFVQDGQPSGFNVELMQAVARVMDLKIDISLGPWAEVRQQLETGEIDALVGMAYSEEREKTVDFTTPHSTLFFDLFVRRSSNLRDLETLADRSIIVQEGGLMHDYLLNNHPEAKVITVQDVPDALRLLASGQHDGALLNKMQGLYFVHELQLENIRIADLDLLPRRYSFAVVEGNAQLQHTLDVGLSILKETGEYREIYDKWFGAYEEAEQLAILRAYWWVPVLILALLGVSVIWSITLRRQVMLRTRDLQMRHQELALLNRIIMTAASTLDVPRVLEVLCRELALALKLPQVAASLVLIDKDYVEIVAEYCEPGRPSALGDRIPITVPSTTYLLEHKKPLVIEDSRRDPGMKGLQELISRRGIKSMLLVPIVVRHRVISTLGLDSTTPRKFTPEELALVQSAATAVGQALETAELHGELQHRADELEVTVAQRTEELQMALKAAQTADRAKSEFVSNVSHELRTPLTSILLYLRLLEQGGPAQRLTYQQALVREAKRLQYLIESLLQISRLDLGKVEPHFETVDLNRMIATLVKDREQLFDSRKQKLSYASNPRLIPIAADPRLLEQVITNLLTNAMNYTPAGGEVDIKTHLLEENEQLWVTIAIKDTGVGIKPEDQSKLFQRFQRGSASETLNIPGTGLGLPISAEIVKLHGGHITVESNVGAGSLFTIWLPVNRS
ncbi:MAG: transporter substrate-binding domain-containing protein [Anaerolineae bacterium]|jgi:signal transduction histidine kinase/ABC-type amino acid transport substrate-binding protein|nr:transporter substrate-binding domain-containing protein [Anaerolineae bacterium]